LLNNDNKVSESSHIKPQVIQIIFIRGAIAWCWRFGVSKAPKYNYKKKEKPSARHFLHASWQQLI